MTEYEIMDAVETEDTEVFQLDETFDPLEDMDDPESQEDSDYDYQAPAPIPDADKSVVPEPVELPPEERLRKLIDGIPGQKFRILSIVEACRELEKPISQIEGEVCERYPQGGSVYDVARLVQLLEQAGALECTNREEVEQAATQAEAEAEACDGADDPADATAKANDSERIAVDKLTVSAEALDTESQEVESAPVELFLATATGIAAVDANSGIEPIVAVITEEERYLPIYERIYHLMDVEGGCPVKDLNNAVDSDPLVEEPRRFCTYFLGRLERCNAAVWHDTWNLTETGKRAFESLFTGKEN